MPAEKEIATPFSFHCPRYDELPSIELYMDQVIQVVSATVCSLYGADDVVTSAMINNYVKHKVIPPPIRKKYDRTHLTRLMVICILKRVFSIGEISALFLVQESTYPLQRAYDYLCTELEDALHVVFTHEHPKEEFTAVKRTPETDLLHSMVLAIAHKAYVQQTMETLRKQSED